MIDNFEGVFVLVILVFVSAIVWFVESKLSFLNFFYLPVLLGSYYLGIRSGVLGAFLCFLIIGIFASIYPDRFTAPMDNFGLAASVLTWAGFLILTAVIVGFTHRELQDKITEALRSKAEASGNAELLEQTMTTQGENIPIGARILAVAEAYISLISNRPYRDPWVGKAALTEISKYVRTGKFDPMVVDTLSEIVGELDKK